MDTPAWVTRKAFLTLALNGGKCSHTRSGLILHDSDWFRIRAEEYAYRATSRFAYLLFSVIALAWTAYIFN